MSLHREAYKRNEARGRGWSKGAESFKSMYTSKEMCNLCRVDKTTN